MISRRPFSYMWYEIEPEGRLECQEKVKEGPAPMIDTLCQRLKDSSSTFVVMEELEGLNVDISRVQNSDDEVHFSPCFFRPHPEKFLQNFPLHPGDYDKDEPYAPPECPSAAQANKRMWNFDEELGQPREALFERFGPYKCSIDRLYDRPFATWHDTAENLDHEWWISEILEARHDRKPALPHLIGELVCGINADRDAQSLSVAELEAIGRIMIEQIWYGQHSIYPVLLLSFIGQGRGRITQAVYWDTELHVQFSQLLSFETEGNELMELLCRYAVCDRVGCEKNPPSIPGSDIEKTEV